MYESGMIPRPTTVMKSFLSLGRSVRVAGALFVSVLAIGCGRYEPEAEYPQQPVDYVAPPPSSAADPAAQQESAAPAVGGREIAIGVDDSEYADTDPSALTEFEPALDGHGQWVNDSTYGTVWVPDRAEVGDDFQPYVTAGHWTYSDDTDYVWVSDYSWGWAPFHYGRWVYLPGHRWSWIPGRRYAGAWVTWRVGAAGFGYIGWAPAPPEWYWYEGVALGWTFGWYDYRPYYAWCPHHDFYHHQVGVHVERGSEAQARYYDRTHDYVPARPSVGGPTNGGGSGDRVVARPSVGGKAAGTRSERVMAEVAAAPSPLAPRPGGASPARGPRPDELGIKNDSVVPPPASNQSLNRAQAFARPATAVIAGAAPPGKVRPSSVTAIEPSSRGPIARGFAPAEVGRARAESTPSFAGSPAPSYAPRTSSSAGASAAPYRASAASAPSYASPAPSFRLPPAAVVTRPPESVPSPAPSYRAPAPSYRAPAPSYRAPAPSYRAPSPSFAPTPSYRAPSSRPSTPSFTRPATSTPSYRPSSSPPRVSGSTTRAAPSVGRLAAPSRSSAVTRSITRRK
jgi:hypothetical protein